MSPCQGVPASAHAAASPVPPLRARGLRVFTRGGGTGEQRACGFGAGVTSGPALCLRPAVASGASGWARRALLRRPPLHLIACFHVPAAWGLLLAEGGAGAGKGRVWRQKSLVTFWC